MKYKQLIPSVLCIDDIESKKLEWLWPNRIAIGKFSLIAGEPGLGKSLVSIDLAARVSNGQSWPVDKSQVVIGKVLMIIGEDSLSDTVRPRLEAVNANLDNIHVLDDLKQVDSKTGSMIDRGFCISQNMEQLSEAIDQIPDCKLVTIDPLGAFLGKIDSHNDAEVRSLLKPLSDLAEQKHVAIIAISHFNKNTQNNAMNRVTGSNAFCAAARSVFGIVKDCQDKTRRYMLPIKNNLGPDSSGFAYSIAQSDNNIPLINWEPELIDKDIDSILSQSTVSAVRAIDIAKDFLQEILAENPRPANEVFELATEQEITKRTLLRAKRALGIRSIKTGQRDNWLWALNDSGEECQ